ncbi:coatomer subunit delta [Achlya hypogyna]|uniref:Coatomer subunit delta n=1 Tax=Achlya hypogyna TaxID=1202772 RepID=A0A1V9ZTQ6_ACHHY|nr:coatomer subunit delta [Achlya hypogyna]
MDGASHVEHIEIPAWSSEDPLPDHWEAELNHELQLGVRQRHASTRRQSISGGLTGLHELLKRNREWAAEMVCHEPLFFEKLSQQQTPQILWIGCSDSRVPPNQILNLKPGEVFVHANVANEVVHSDLNCLSVLEYAVVHLKVKHVIVCGHYGCTGVKAALSRQEFGIVDNWLRNIKDLCISRWDQLQAIEDPKKKLNLLTELNVAKSVYNVCHTRIVQNAWKAGRELSVHGWCYSVEDGEIRDLNLCISNESSVEPIYQRMMEKEEPQMASIPRTPKLRYRRSVVLSAALLAKNGKVMVARQFVEVSRIRLEGLLTAFPKLLASESRQHTFIDTESVRYVYQPIESYFLLLITNKTSNIVEDLHTMQLMAKLVPDICGTLTEAHIRDKQFDLIFGFDELLTAGGHAENINIAQIRTNMEMESHEEKLHMMIQKTKQENAIADMKRQQARIKEEQREKARMEKAAGLSSPFNRNSSYGGSSFGSGGGFSSPSSSSSSFKAPEPTYTEAPKLSAAASKTSGMKLGGSKPGNSFLDAMAAEDDLKEIPPMAMAAANVPAPTAKPAPAAAVSMEPVGIAIEEKISVVLNRDGAVEQLEVKGSLFVAGNDPESATHPKVDKKLFEAQSVLALKDDSKPFPPSRVAVLRWAIKTQDETFLPINITCWPEEEGSGKMTVSLEYAMDRDMTLENVNIVIPLGAADMPHISHIDGDYRHNPADGTLLWHLDSVSPSNSSGSLEFGIRGNDLDAFFPIHVSFFSRSIYCDLAVDSVLRIADGSAVKYGFDQLVSTDTYVIQ